MSTRYCATDRCSGMLRAGIGSHCPRCGGTAFLPPRRRARWAVLILLAVLAAGAAFILTSSRKTARVATPERRTLVEAHDVAVQMTIPSARDDAYAVIVHRALAQHDFEYACQLGGEMSIPSNKDECLLAVVQEALKLNQRDWATRAAGEMVNPSNRDDAFRKILDAAAPR